MLDMKTNWTVDSLSSFLHFNVWLNLKSGPTYIKQDFLSQDKPDFAFVFEESDKVTPYTG